VARLDWTEPARDDLARIRRYIARDSKTAAARIAQRILAAARRLRSFPQSGSPFPAVTIAEVRTLVVGQYLVYYQVLPNEVRTLMVKHGAQLLDLRELHARI